MSQSLDEPTKALTGRPDGPKVWRSEFGMEVGTFTAEAKGDKIHLQTLAFHVPITMRGYYRPIELDDYSGDPADYDIDDHGYVKCDETTKQGNPCPHRAVNRQPMCQLHGGALHPFDKVVMKSRPRKIVSRTEQLVHGLIAPEELDQEELIRGYCRGPNGQFGRPPRKVPRTVHDMLLKELYRRADDHLEHGIFDMAQVMMEIAKGTAYEPADRIKAATWVYERVRGKEPLRVVHEQAKPWEVALSGIVGGSREESRLARGLDPDSGEPLDVEWYDDNADTVQPDNGDRPGGDGGSGNLHIPESAQLELFSVEPEPYDEVTPMREIEPSPAVEEPAEVTPEERRELINKARAKRYAARSRGMEYINNIPLDWTEKELEPGVHRLKFILPEDTKLPRGMLLREERQRRRESP